MKRKVISWILILCLIVTLAPLGSVKASAATGTADSLVAHATSHIGDKYNTFGDQEPFTGEWCAAFIQHCAVKAGLSAKIPTSGCTYVNDMAYNVVNKKNGKITFVNKNFYNSKKANFTSSKVVYNANYKPRKGDLIIFSSDLYYWSHIGIVAENSSNPLKNVRTIEGNTGNDSWKYSTVAKKTRNSVNTFYIVAYVTPNYSNTQKYTVKFSANGGKNLSKSSISVTSGKAIGTLPTVSRSGYTFKGWYTKTSGGTKVTASTKITKSQTLYAQWTKNTTTATPAPATSVVYTWPIDSHGKNTITGHWGLESGHYYPYHYGIDIAAPKNTKVRAAADGTVIHAGLYGAYGYCVQIKHANGQVTLYGHNTKVNVKKNAKVKRGDVVAYVGGTGTNGIVQYGYHCHFGIYKNQSALNKEDGRAASQISYDPLKYLKENVTYNVTFHNAYTDSTWTKPASKTVVISNNKGSFTTKTPSYTYTGRNFTGWTIKKVHGNTKYFLVKSGSGWKWSTSKTNWKLYKGDNSFTFYTSSGSNNKVEAGDTIQVFAQFAKKTYNIKYNANGGSGAPPAQTKTYGTSLKLSTKVPVRTGYIFKGWTVSGSSTVYKPGATFTTNANTTLTAKWEKEQLNGGFLVTKDEYDSRYSGNSRYTATPMYRYKTRAKETITNGYPSVNGYTMQTKSLVNTTYGNWLTSAPRTSTTNGSTYQTVVSKESKTAYTSYAYFTDNKQKCWKATNGGYYPNLLKIYSSKSVSASGYKKDTDGSYFLPRTISISNPGKMGTIYRFSYKGNYATSFTAGTNLGYTFVWPTSTKTQTIYRTVTKKYKYTHYKLGEWSEWSEWTPEYKVNSDSVSRDTEVMYYIKAK